MVNRIVKALFLVLLPFGVNAADVWSPQFSIKEVYFTGKGVSFTVYGSAANSCKNEKFRLYKDKGGQTDESVQNIVSTIVAAQQLAALEDIATDKLPTDFFSVRYDDKGSACYVKVFKLHPIQ